MLTHGQIWTAIDELARNSGLSASGLARQAGLDPSTFNRSKRHNAEGQPRWPSTESIAKILAATETSIDDFLALVASPAARAQQMIPFAQMREDTFAILINDAGFENPVWQKIAFPDLGDTHVAALEICGDAHAPFYRDGDILIISAQAPRRRGDRVLVIEEEGGALIALLGHQTTTHLQLTSLLGEVLPLRPLGRIRYLARILWASQ